MENSQEEFLMKKTKKELMDLILQQDKEENKIKTEIRKIKNEMANKQTSIVGLLDCNKALNKHIVKIEKEIQEQKSDEITYKFTIATLQATITKMVK